MEDERIKHGAAGQFVEAESAVPSARSNGGKRLSSFVWTFLIMFAGWIVLSGRFDVFFLVLGMLASCLVAYFSGELLFPEGGVKRPFTRWLRFLGYAPWLIYQIFKSGLHVTRLVFHPRMMELIDPKLIRFKSKLTSDLSRTTFANSITLTPGTITVFVNLDGEFTVHAIDSESAESLPGEMEERIARVFGEG